MCYFLSSPHLVVVLNYKRLKYCKQGCKFRHLGYYDFPCYLCLKFGANYFEPDSSYHSKTLYHWVLVQLECGFYEVRYVDGRAVAWCLKRNCECCPAVCDEIDSPDEFDI